MSATTSGLANSFYSWQIRIELAESVDFCSKALPKIKRTDITSLKRISESLAISLKDTKYYERALYWKKIFHTMYLNEGMFQDWFATARVYKDRALLAINSLFKSGEENPDIPLPDDSWFRRSIEKLTVVFREYADKVEIDRRKTTLYRYFYGKQKEAEKMAIADAYPKIFDIAGDVPAYPESYPRNSRFVVKQLIAASAFMFLPFSMAISPILAGAHMLGTAMMARYWFKYLSYGSAIAEYMWVISKDAGKRLLDGALIVGTTPWYAVAPVAHVIWYYCVKLLHKAASMLNPEWGDWVLARLSQKAEAPKEDELLTKFSEITEVPDENAQITQSNS